MSALSILYDPTQPPTVEADTLLLPDLSSEATIRGGGGLLSGLSTDSSPSLAGQMEWGPGRHGPALRSKAGAASRPVVKWLADGLTPADEWTIEFSFRRDAPWPQTPAASEFLFAVLGNNELLVTARGPGLLWVQAICQPLGTSRLWSMGAGTLGLLDTGWHTLALAYQAQTITVIVDGKAVGTLAGCDYLPVWSSGTHGQGVMLCGTPGRPNQFWTSDLRISRTARTVGQQTPLRSLEGTVDLSIASNFTATKAASPADLSGSVTSSGTRLAVGSLHPSPTVPPAQTRGRLEFIRTDKLINATPISRTPDADHQVIGHSGRFWYDWKVVDRVVAWFVAHGVEMYLSVDSTPALLGGHSPPFSGKDPAGSLSNVAGYNVQPPNNLDDWAAIVGDLVEHITQGLRFQPIYYSVWNEPTGFLRGGSYLDLYGATVNAIRTADPQARVGGPEDFLSPAGSYIQSLTAQCAANNIPLDFVSFHLYSGDLSDLDRGRLQVDHAVGHTGMPVVIGEYGFGSDVLQAADWHGGPWWAGAFGASFLLASLIRMQQIGYEAVTITATQYSSSTDPWSQMSLFRADGMPYAPANMLKGWQVLGPAVSVTADLPPGVFCQGSRDPATGAYGLALANHGYSQRAPRVVNVTLPRDAPSYRVRQWLVDRQHSNLFENPQDPHQADLQQTGDAILPGGAVLTLTLPAWSCLFVRVEPIAAAPVLKPYVDAGQLVPAGKQSYYAQPMLRGWCTTVPASQTLAGVGVVYELPASANHEAVIARLATVPVATIRIEAGWGALSYDETTFSNAAYYRQIFTACAKHGVSPVVLLSAHQGLPCPMRVSTATVTQDAPAGARVLSLDSTAGLVIGQSGIPIPGVNKAAAILFTSILSGAVTLSAPLPMPIPAGTKLTIQTLKYPPLWPVGTKEFEATAAGWLKYVSLVCDLLESCGLRDFLIEFTNEMGFGSEYIKNTGYYSPAPLVLTGQPDMLRPGGTLWELCKRTVEAVKGR